MIGHATTITSTAGWTRPDFDAYRPKMTTIGASEVFGFMFGARLEAVLQRRGVVERFKGSSKSSLGHVSEPIALAMLSKYLDRPVQAAQCIVSHPTLTMMHATPDGLTVGTEGMQGVEAKWTSGYNRAGVELLCEHGPNAAIDTYAFRAWLQAVYSLLVTGLDVWWVCWVVGGEALARGLAGMDPEPGDFMVHPVRRDDEDVAAMIAMLEREIPAFNARFIEGDELPAPNPDAAGDLKAIGKAYRVSIGLEVDAPGLADACAAYVWNRDLVSGAKKAQDKAKALILAEMGEAQIASVPGYIVKRSKRGALTVKERKA